MSKLNFSAMQVVMNATGGLQTRLLTDTQQNGLWFELSQVWVNGNNVGGSNEYLVASDLDQNTDYTIRVFNTLEPSFNGGSNSPSSFYTFMGFLVDGDAGPASAPLGRVGTDMRVLMLNASEFQSQFDRSMPARLACCGSGRPQFWVCSRLLPLRCAARARVVRPPLKQFITPAFFYNGRRTSS